MCSISEGQVLWEKRAEYGYEEAESGVREVRMNFMEKVTFEQNLEGIERGVSTKNIL